MAMFDRLHTEPVYNTRAVVQRTGVPADTFRAWERRYHLPAPCRSGGNQRLYCDRDVAIIAWLRDQTRNGMTISHAVTLFLTLDRDDPRTPEYGVRGTPEREPAARVGDAPHESPAPEPRVSFYQTCLDLIEALRRFDAPIAEKILEEKIAFSSVETVCHEVLRPTMNEIRRRLSHGALPASVERFSHAYLQRKVSALFNLSHPEIGRGPVLAAGVEGDHEELELLYLSLFLSRGGFAVVYLGPDVATSDLEQVTASIQPVLVLLNASSEATAPVLEDAVRKLHPPDAGDSAPMVGYTGEVFDRMPTMRRTIDAHFFGGDGYHATSACDRLVSSLRPGR